MRLRGAASGAAGADFHVTSNIREVLADLKELDPKLATATRRKLRQSGDEVIKEMRAALAEESPGVVTGVTRRRRRITSITTGAANRSRSSGSRAAAAAALKTRVVAGKSRQKIRIVGAGDPFSRSYNMRFWRHPIRFNPATTSKNQVPWVTQAGRPYFGSVAGKHWRDVRKNIDEAINEALEAIARGK